MNLKVYIHGLHMQLCPSGVWVQSLWLWSKSIGRLDHTIGWLGRQGSSGQITCLTYHRITSIKVISVLLLLFLVDVFFSYYHHWEVHFSHFSSCQLLFHFFSYRCLFKLFSQEVPFQNLKKSAFFHIFSEGLFLKFCYGVALPIFFHLPDPKWLAASQK